MEKDKKKITVIVISILIVLILLIAIAYAYFSTQLSGTDQIVKVGELELVLDETSEGINLDSAVGISDSKGMALNGSTFELRNNGNNAVDYTIYLDDNTIGDTDTRIDDKYLKYNLNKNGADSGATLLTRIGTNPNRVLDSGTIEGKTTNKYKLNLWITDEVDGNYSGQVFSGKLRVEVSQEKDKRVATVITSNLGDNGSTYDDGEDTFITGTEPNNYVWYSGKLWRVVSVNNEAKTTKLVTQWNISTINYSNGNSTFEGSYIEEWLNDTTADGFLGNLRNPEKFIVMDTKWNATQDDTALGSITRPKETVSTTSAVGLLNLYEYQSSYTGTTYSNGYLNNGLFWWTLTPYNSSYIRSIDYDGKTSNILPGDYSYGIRPSVNLNPDIKIVSGNGTEETPYRLMGDNDDNLKGTRLNTRYSGEYIRFGTGENNLYRIVSHETQELTKITSDELLKNDGAFLGTIFGNDTAFSRTNTIGSFLNEEYLISSNYLTSEQANMIENSSVWYLGTVNNGTSYKLAKYIDEKGITITSNVVDAKVGLLRYGELMAGQFNRYAIKGGTESANLTTDYWLITPYDSLYVRDIYNAGGSSGLGFSNERSSIKPVLNLKSNVIITSGDGTKENPFEIALQ